jgi:hypothetical protein
MKVNAEVIARINQNLEKSFNLSVDINMETIDLVKHMVVRLHCHKSNLGFVVAFTDMFFSLYEDCYLEEINLRVERTIIKVALQMWKKP